MAGPVALFLAKYKRLWKDQSARGIIAELRNFDQSGENILAEHSEEELKRILNNVNVDERVEAMDMPTRILLFTVSCAVLAHKTKKASDMSKPRERVKWDESNSFFHDVVKVRMPYNDEEASCAGSKDTGMTKMQVSLLAMIAKIPLSDEVDPGLEFDGIAEGIAFGDKVLGPALPKPRFCWKDLSSDQAQSNIAYYGIGQLHLSLSDDDSRGEHMVDLRAMGNFKVRPSFERYGAAAYFHNRRITGIFWSHGDRFATPEDEQWEHIKFAWRVSLFTWVTAIDHLVHIHYIVSNALNTSLRECLPPDHPVRRLMHVSVFGASKVNCESIYTLGVDGSFLHRAMSLEWEGGMREVLDYASSSYRFQTFPELVASSDLPKNVKDTLPLFVDGLEVWKVYHGFYSSVVDMYFEDEDAVLGDQDIAEYWRFRCVPQYMNGLPSLSKAALVDQLTHASFGVTAQHQVAGDIVQYVTLPNGMCFQIRPGHDMEDARQMTNVLAITASTGRTMPRFCEDWSHLLPGPADGPEQCRKLKDLHKKLVMDLKSVGDKVEERCKEQPVAFTELNPKAFECSVSI